MAIKGNTHVAHSSICASIGDIVSETRQTYQGPLVFGEDLMTFDIGKGGVAVYREAP
jgi:hypothetical protein